MRERLKNELLVMLDQIVDVENLREISGKIDVILSDYEIEKRKTDIIIYGSDIPESVKIYAVSKKIAGLSDKTLSLYLMVLTDFFRTVQKKPEILRQMI